MFLELWQAYCMCSHDTLVDMDYFITKLRVKLHESTLGLVSHLLNTISPHSGHVNLQQGELP